jgi:hypothetical protein
MARATRASGERNPKAMRVRSRSLVFTLSTRALDSPWVRPVERRVGLGNPGQRRGLAFGEIAGVLPQREAGVLQVLREVFCLGGAEELVAAQVAHGLGVERLLQRRGVGVGDPGQGAHRGLGDLLQGLVLPLLVQHGVEVRADRHAIPLRLVVVLDVGVTVATTGTCPAPRTPLGVSVPEAPRRTDGSGGGPGGGTPRSHRCLVRWRAEAESGAFWGRAAGTATGQ